MCLGGIASIEAGILNGLADKDVRERASTTAFSRKRQAMSIDDRLSRQFRLAAILLGCVCLNSRSALANPSDGGLIESAQDIRQSWVVPSTFLNVAMVADDELPSPDTDSAEKPDDAAKDNQEADIEFVPLADYKKLLERVEEVEESWGKYKDKVDEESAEKKKKPTMKINGRVHLDQWSFLDSDAGTNFLETGNITRGAEDRWQFRRLRLELQGDVPNNMLYRMQVDFNNPQAPEIKDAYLGFNNLPNNQTLLIGNQKRPIGMDHLNSSRHNVFIERPLAVETFNEDARRIGACMYGYSDDEVVNWRYGVFLLENPNLSGNVIGDFDEAGLYGRLAASPWYDDISGGRGYFHCAIAGSVNAVDGDGSLDAGTNPNNARFRTRPLARSNERWYNTGRILGADNYEQLAFESVLNLGAIQITGEYINNWVQRDPLGGFSGDDLFFHGGYVFVNYFFTGEYIPLERVSGTIDRVKPLENFFIVDRCRGGTGRGWGALSMGLRYDHMDLTDSDIQGGVGDALTLSTNWYWTAYSKLQTNLIWGDIAGAGENLAPSPTLAGVSGEYTILGMRYMIDF